MVAYSGATPHLLPFIHRARIVDEYAGLVGGYRSGSRAAPYNLYARPAHLLAEARGASTAHDIGFRFGPAPSGGASRHVPFGRIFFGVVHVRRRDL